MRAGFWFGRNQRLFRPPTRWRDVVFTGVLCSVTPSRTRFPHPPTPQCRSAGKTYALSKSALASGQSVAEFVSTAAGCILSTGHAGDVKRGESARYFRPISGVAHSCDALLLGYAVIRQKARA
jgi:hypothetical protein